MIELASLFEKSLENDKDTLISTMLLLLNAELYEPTLSNLQNPTPSDPLLYDIWDRFTKMESNLDQGIAQEKKLSDFFQILTEHKIALKELEKVFRYVDSERKLFRKISAALIKKIADWQINNDFYESSEADILSTKLYRINYEILQRGRERLEESNSAITNQMNELNKKVAHLERRNKALEKRVKINQSQMKELLLCDQKSKNIS